MVPAPKPSSVESIKPAAPLLAAVLIVMLVTAKALTTILSGTATGVVTGVDVRSESVVVIGAPIFTTAANSEPGVTMSRGHELASALVRTQLRLRASEKALARFVSEGNADQPKMASKHVELLQAVTAARNDIDVLEGMMRRELERPFDLLAFKMAVP